jgi:hypothetical protein
MFAEFEDVMLEETGQTGPGLKPDARFRGGAKLDEVTVVHRLNLGARLALDARRLPPVLAEHLGCWMVLHGMTVHLPCPLA